MKMSLYAIVDRCQTNGEMYFGTIFELANDETAIRAFSDTIKPETVVYMSSNNNLASITTQDSFSIDPVAWSTVANL